MSRKADVLLWFQFGAINFLLCCLIAVTFAFLTSWASWESLKTQREKERVSVLLCAGMTSLQNMSWRGGHVEMVRIVHSGGDRNQTSEEDYGNGYEYTA